MSINAKKCLKNFGMEEEEEEEADLRKQKTTTVS
jgi:hypothetical protein